MVYLGVEPRSVRVVLAEGLCDLAGITSAEGLRNGEAGRAPFLIMPWHSPYNWGAARGLLVVPTWLSFEGLPRLASWTSDHPVFPGDFSQPSAGTSAFRVAVLRGSPHQLIRVETIGQCSDVVGEEWNPQILVNLRVTNVPRCVGSNAKALGL
jgi:hypothetical protein